MTSWTSKRNSGVYVASLAFKQDEAAIDFPMGIVGLIRLAPGINRDTRTRLAPEELFALYATKCRIDGAAFSLMEAAGKPAGRLACAPTSRRTVRHSYPHCTLMVLAGLTVSGAECGCTIRRRRDTHPYSGSRSCVGSSSLGAALVEGTSAVLSGARVSTHSWHPTGNRWNSWPSQPSMRACE